MVLQIKEKERRIIYVVNQQKWDSLGADTWVGLGDMSKHPEGLVMESPFLDGLGLHLPSTL